MSNTIITSAGAAAACSASPVAPTFAIKYFVPVYDERIDTTIHTPSVSAGNQFAAITMSESMSASDLIPTGEIIYNLTGEYEISSDELLYTTSGETTAASGSNTAISGSNKNDTAVYNTVGSAPLSTMISGSTFVAPPSSGGNWVVADYGLVSSAASASPVFLSAVGNMYPIASYTPIVSGAQTRGMFKCRLDETTGDFKFNKIALYIVELDGDNQVVTSAAPTLFAIAALNTTVHKTTTGFNIANVEIDVELEFSHNADLSNLMFSTHDNWWQVPGTSGIDDAIFTDKDVAIGTSGVAWVAYAKLQVTDANKPQQRLGYDVTTASDVFVTSAGQRRVTTSGAGTSFGNDTNVATGTHSFAAGITCSATGDGASSFGQINNASGNYSFIAGGSGNRTSGVWSFAAGILCSATGSNSISIGIENRSAGTASFALGYQSTATGNYSFAVGHDAYVSALDSMAFGTNISATGAESFAFGTNIIVTSNTSVGIGLHSTSLQTMDRTNTFGIMGGGAFVGLSDNTTSAVGTFAVGTGNNVSLQYSMAAGVTNSCLTLVSFAFGISNSVSGQNSMAIGGSCTVSGAAAFATGWHAQALSDYSFAAGFYAQATGSKSIAMGDTAIAAGSYAVAIGAATSATGSKSYSFGQQNIASGIASVAWGYMCSATQDSAWALGYYAKATGTRSWAIQLSGSTPIPVTASDTFGIVGGNVWHEGYTKLGPWGGSNPSYPNIRVAEYSFTSPTLSGTLAIPHGLTSSKILSVDGVIEAAGDPTYVIPPNSSISTRYWEIREVNSTNIIVLVGGSATSVDSESGKLIVVYKE